MSATHAEILDANHYLGNRGARAKLVYTDACGVIVFSGVSSRRLPAHWLELSRWCITAGLGSQQWRACLRWFVPQAPNVTTIVSYSDPSVSHDGALYRACNWVWAPTWHCLREPPTGSGTRGGKTQRAKHRWVYLLREDSEREERLTLRDESLNRRYPWVGYTEPAWRRGKPVLSGELQGRWRRWHEQRVAEVLS